MAGMEQGDQQGQEQAGPQSRTPSEVVASLNDTMIEFSEILGASQQIPPQSKQKFAQIVQAFRSFINEDLGKGGPEQQQQQQPQAGGSVPEQAGSNEGAVPVG